MKPLKYVILVLVAALGGSAAGAIFTGLSEGELSFAPVVFAVSLPFTLVGATLLTGVGCLLRESLLRDWSTYFPIFMVALIAGPLMTLPFEIDVWLAFVGGVFALMTAACWVAVYRVLWSSQIEAIENA